MLVTRSRCNKAPRPGGELWRLQAQDAGAVGLSHLRFSGKILSLIFWLTLDL